MGNTTSFLTIRQSTRCDQPKVIFITGASSGMGKEMALTMIRRGHVVYGGAPDMDGMQELVEAGGRALFLDVTDHQVVLDVIQTILKEQGKIDVLVNNAGIATQGSIEDVPLHKVRKLFDVNFFGVVDITQQVIPHMREARSGLIVNISSVNGRLYPQLQGPYIASKHAIEGWSDCLRVELSPFNIDVAIFEPGFIKTEIFRVFEDLTPEDSVYAPVRDAQVEMYKHYVERGSHPSVVANCLIQAVEGYWRPKRRYVMGFMARLLLFIRFGLGDAINDIVMKMPTYKARLTLMMKERGSNHANVAEKATNEEQTNGHVNIAEKAENDALKFKKS